MAGYSPLKITGYQTGLVQEREEFLLPNDAYPALQNAYVWRERILRKKGYQLLGRLQRKLGTTDGAGNFSIVIKPFPLNTGIASFNIDTDLFNDPGTTLDPGVQTLFTNSSGSGTLNRVTGLLTITGSKPNTDIYYIPGLPVMGITIREKQDSSNDETIFFDQAYAYKFNQGSGKFIEFIPGKTWNLSNAPVSGIDFFWSTNYWTTNSTPNPFGTPNNKIFWVTNNTGSQGANADPIRITDGLTWVDFSPPTYGKINSTDFVVQCLAFLPFRGRLVMFNTWEGTSYGNALHYSNRIRWSTIGNPFIPFSAGPPATGSWRDDIRGQGGFLDIPTSEDIVSVGFVRDNLVIFCERSTWQLRYTGRSIAPFQIEKVNSELGTESAFSSVQFDTSLVGIGDKGIVECDSYKSERIDVKIPDFVFQFNAENNGVSRVQGVRDFEQRLAFWTVPIAASYDANFPTSDWIFPNQRLVYNYENDSWALFNDSLTALGSYQVQASRNWLNTPIPWIKCKFNWLSQPNSDRQVVGGNQQGFIEFLDELTVNDPSLFISNIVGNAITPTTGNPTVITSPNHNMQSGFVIGISGIPTGTPYDNLNGGIFEIEVKDKNTFELFIYNNTTGQFSDSQLDVPSGNYAGGGLINIRENFSIKSKKFNFLDEGQSIQFGFLDILMQSTSSDQPGAISLNVYLDYNDSSVSNIAPENDMNDGSTFETPDTFFNSIIPTTPSTLNNIGGTKFWQRVICPTRANFITLEYSFSNAQMAGGEQNKEVQIDAQVLWIRKAGRMTQI